MSAPKSILGKRATAQRKQSAKCLRKSRAAFANAAPGVGAPSFASKTKRFLEMTNVLQFPEAIDEWTGALGDFGHKDNPINEIVDMQITRGAWFMLAKPNPSNGTCTLCRLPRHLTAILYRAAPGATQDQKVEIGPCGSVCQRRMQLMKEFKGILADALDCQLHTIPEVQAQEQTRVLTRRFVAARGAAEAFLRSHDKNRSGVVRRRKNSANHGRA